MCVGGLEEEAVKPKVFFSKFFFNYPYLIRHFPVCCHLKNRCHLTFCKRFYVGKRQILLRTSVHFGTNLSFFKINHILNDLTSVIIAIMVVQSFTWFMSSSVSQIKGLWTELSPGYNFICSEKCCKLYARLWRTEDLDLVRI